MTEDQEQTLGKPQDSVQALLGLPNRYTNKGMIGRGGMGIVFRAGDLQLGRDVAIKVLLFEGATDPTLQERFSREAKMLASLNHPNIVKILAWGVTDAGNPYQVMEFLEGPTLASQIGLGKRLSPARFQEVFSAVLAGLDHAHSRGIVHRDIKPSNIILCQTGEEFCPKIVDFGIARMQMPGTASDRTLTQTGHMLGSPAYMSPEQCKAAQIDHLSDIYSLGCVMYEALTGQTPQQGETSMELMYKHMMVPAASLETLASGSAGKRLGKLVDRCLSKDPQERPQSCREIVAELSLIFESELETRKIFAQDLSKPKGKSLPLATLGLLLGVLITACFCWTKFHYQNTIELKSDISSSKKRIAELEAQMPQLERRYKQADAGFRKMERAEDLVKVMTNIAQAYYDSREFKNADSNFRKALEYCGYTSDPPFYSANVFLSIGNCKLAINESSDAEQAFRDGLGWLSHDSQSSVSQSEYARVSSELAEGLAILHIRNHKFDNAGTDVSVLIGKSSPQSLSMIQNISNKLALEKLNGSEESMAALNLYGQLAGYLLSKGSGQAGKTTERILQLIQTIPPDTQNFRALAERTYRLLAKYNELIQNTEGSARFRKLADSYRN